MLTLSGITLSAQIHESSRSSVYRGIRDCDNQRVILKVLKQNYPTPKELLRYRQEYEITKSLQLPGAIAAYNLEKYQNTLIIVLEDIQGESLKIWLTQREFSLSEFLDIAIKLADSLAQIHAAKIIHKDINPSNIIFNPQTQQLKIIDFGLATVLPRENPLIHHPNVLEGTLAYLSPEQTGRMNRTLDYRTDFYSLGVTLYELLTHQLPFPTTDVMELIHCHLARQPIPPQEIDPSLPTVLGDIIAIP
jgi:serine/threonine protein kinase